MAVTAETVARHELVGLEATVTQATNPDLEGTSGTVVSETTNTLVLEDDRERTVPKDAAQFAVTLPTGATVTVDGDRLVARPARRTETRGDSTWR